MKKLLLTVSLLALTLIFAGCESAGDNNNNASGGNNNDKNNAAGGCIHEYSTVATRASTCEVAGAVTERCAICKDEKITVLSLADHDYERCRVLPTCTDEGEEYDECKACGKQTNFAELSKLSHSYIYDITSPTCESGGYTVTTCENCDLRETGDVTEALGHSFGDWEVIKTATDVSDGLKERNCGICSYTETAYITSTSYVDLSLIRSEFNESTTYEVASYEELLFKFKVAVINLAGSLKCSLGFEVGDFSTMLNDLIGDFDSPYGFSVQAGLLGTELTFEFTYRPEPAKKSTAVHYTQYSSLNYKSLTSNRSESFDGFKINDSVYTFNVKTTDQLVYALERGVKPLCEAGSSAERAYAELKKILISIVDDDMTDYEKVRAIHDHLIMNVTYDKELYDSIYLNPADIQEYNGFYLEGVLFDKVAVCEGISKAFTALCNIEGIPAVTVTGYQSANPEGVGHAWNKVYIDGTWYIADATSDGTIINGEYEILSYQYFLIKEADFEKVYIGEDFTNISCTSNMEVYDKDVFAYNGVNYDFVISSQAELDILIAYFEASKAESLTVEIKFAFDIGESASDEIGSAYFNNGIFNTCGYIANDSIYVLVKNN